MTKNKRIFVVVVALADMLGVVSCGRNGTGNTATTKQAEPLPASSLKFSVKVKTENTSTGSYDIALVEKLIVITNRSETPLVLNAISINGEYDFTPENAVKTINRLPRKLTIGESLAFKVNSHQESSIPNYPKAWNGYTKEIIFVDVKTDQGTVRFDSSSF